MLSGVGQKSVCREWDMRFSVNKIVHWITRPFMASFETLINWQDKFDKQSSPNQKIRNPRQIEIFEVEKYLLCWFITSLSCWIWNNFIHLYWKVIIILRLNYFHTAIYKTSAIRRLDITFIKCSLFYREIQFTNA